jgi:hypothetical protein
VCRYRECVIDGEGDEQQRGLDEPSLIGQETPQRPERPFARPDQIELVEALDDAVMLRRLVTLVGYIGDGRPVDEMGDLTPYDTDQLRRLLDIDDPVEGLAEQLGHLPTSGLLPSLNYVIQVALVAGLLRNTAAVDIGDLDDERDLDLDLEDPFDAAIDDADIVPGPQAHLAEGVSLQLAEVAFQAMLEDAGPTTVSDDFDPRYGFASLAEEIDAMAVKLLFWLDQDDGRLFAVDDLATRVWQLLQRELNLDAISGYALDDLRRLVVNDVSHLLRRYAELGVVFIIDEYEVGDGEGRTGVKGGRVGIEPLGRWLLLRLAAEVLGTRGTAEDFVNLGAADMLRAAADLPGAQVEARIDGWLDATGEGAAEALVEAWSVVSSVERRLAYHTLLRLGSDRAPSPSRMEELGQAELAFVYGVDSGQAPLREVDRAGDPAGWVALVATVIELLGSAAAMEWAGASSGSLGITVMLERAWRVGGTDTPYVLDTIGSSHPDKKTAKAARKALFKLRSAD